MKSKPKQTNKPPDFFPGNYSMLQMSPVRCSPHRTMVTPSEEALSSTTVISAENNSQCSPAALVKSCSTSSQKWSTGQQLHRGRAAEGAGWEPSLVCRLGKHPARICPLLAWSGRLDLSHEHVKDLPTPKEHTESRHCWLGVASAALLKGSCLIFLQ